MKFVDSPYPNCNYSTRVGPNGRILARCGYCGKFLLLSKCKIGNTIRDRHCYHCGGNIGN